jgi:hypothetical protein
MILYSLVPIQRINASTVHTIGPQRHEMKYFVPFVAIGRAYHRVSRRQRLDTAPSHSLSIPGRKEGRIAVRSLVQPRKDAILFKSTRGLSSTPA